MWTKKMMKSEEKVRQLYLKKSGLIKKTLGEQLREDQLAVRAERFQLLLKMLCVVITIGYLTWITIDLINS